VPHRFNPVDLDRIKEYTMPKCLFCQRVVEEPTAEDRFTDEHVFPAALGGVLVVVDGTCGKCNNGLSKVEQPLAEELTPFRFLLQIPDRYGKVPHTEATLKTAEKVYEGRVRGDGTVQPKPIVTEEKGEGGAREFVHRFITARQKEKLQRLAKEKGQQLIEMGPGDPVTAEVHIGGDLRVIGTQEGLRTVAKIAYVGLAYITGVTMATGGAFDEVRVYIRTGEGKSPIRLFVNDGFMNAFQQGPHQHAIVIAARHDRKRVDAVVRLFGTLCYFVTLSDHYEGADFCQTLVYDAYRGEVNGMLFGHEQAELLQTEDVATSRDTLWDDVAAAGKKFCEFLDAEIQAKFARDREAAKRKTSQPTE
jgi:hypothetical protein